MMPIQEGAGTGLHLPHLDKVVHFGMFAVLGWLGMYAGRKPGPPRYRGIFLLGLGLAILSELGQMMPFVHRDAGLDDLAADMTGVIVGLATYAFARPGVRVPSPETP
ncbi:VanZ family protein [Tundrisphaera sp. TA3]|uniref:VanZ family protein n=1 Tax=Tundrisphaera sp. TA3 TaxID=3435775 RepID=UPI003EBCB169